MGGRELQTHLKVFTRGSFVDHLGRNVRVDGSIYVVLLVKNQYSKINPFPRSLNPHSKLLQVTRRLLYIISQD